MSIKKDLVFISYAREDQELATKLYEELDKVGISVWLDAKNINPGENWKVCISNTVKKSRWFIALLSGNSVNKVGYVQKELKLALDVLDEYSEQDIYLIPVRLENCKPTSERIYDLNWVDLFPSWNDGVKRIADYLLSEIENGKTMEENIFDSKTPVLNDYFKQLLKDNTQENKKETIKKIILNNGKSERVSIDTIKPLMQELVQYAMQLKPDHILGVNRGGVMIGSYISLCIGLPSSKFHRIQCIKSKPINIDLKSLSGRVLILDDIVRSGSTIKDVYEYVNSIDEINDIYSATLVLSLQNKKENLVTKFINFHSAVTYFKDILLPWTPTASGDDGIIKLEAYNTLIG